MRAAAIIPIPCVPPMPPLPPEDSVTYWSAEQDQPVRPSAFYEVRTVLMDPEEARSNAGLVYAVGQSVVPRIDLALGSSRSEIVFDRPASIAASLPGSIPVSPARPAPRRDDTPPGATSAEI